MSDIASETTKLPRRVRRAHIAREFITEGVAPKVGDAEIIETPDAATRAAAIAAIEAANAEAAATARAAAAAAATADVKSEIWISPAAAPPTDYQLPHAAIIAAEASIVEKQGFGRPFAYAAAIAFALGLGWLGGIGSRAPEAAFNAPRPAIFSEWKDAFQLGLGPVDEHTRRAADEIALLRHRVDSMKDGVDRISADQDMKALRQSTVQLQGTVNEAVSKMQALATQPDRNADMAALIERLDRIERRLSQTAETQPPAPAQTPSPAQAATPQPTPRPMAANTADNDITGSIPKDKPKGPAIVEGWSLRGVDGEIALIQGRYGVREVIVGDTVPGLGRIDAIRRHGNSWAVLTSRGLILPSVQ